MTTPNIEELIAKLRTSMGDLDCPNTYEFAMHQAADALQSQAERIKALEAETRHKAPIIATWRNKHDTLRAQIAAIAATEPVLVVEKEPDYWSGGHFHEGSKPHIKPTKVWCLPIGTQLFTHPMPAQDVNAEPVEGLNRSYTEQLINALHENSDPVSIDAAEEFQRLLAA